MKSLYEPVQISQLTMKNRAVRSATLEYSGSKDGRLTDELCNIYEKLAQGGVGTIITGMIGIDEKSRIMPIMIKAYDKRFVQDYQKLSDILHRYDCKIIAQITHCGVKATYIDDGQPPVGPSERVLPSGKIAEALTVEEINGIIDSFTKAAIACNQAGFDGVQIHSAHGYLLSQFLSPTFNKREDDYGGSIENRARIVFEVYQAIRDAVNTDYPVWIKINSEDLTDDGLTAQDSRWVCQQLDQMGIDAVEISGGVGISKTSIPSPKVKTEEDEGMFVNNAIQIANVIKAPVICVGGFRTPAIIEHALNQGNIEAISLCRPLISEPDIIKRWQEGRQEKSRCISCNKCFSPKNGFACQTFDS